MVMFYSSKIRKIKIITLSLSLFFLVVIILKSFWLVSRQFDIVGGTLECKKHEVAVSFPHKRRGHPSRMDSFAANEANSDLPVKCKEMTGSRRARRAARMSPRLIWRSVKSIGPQLANESERFHALTSKRDVVTRIQTRTANTSSSHCKNASPGSGTKKKAQHSAALLHFTQLGATKS